MDKASLFEQIASDIQRVGGSLAVDHHDEQGTKRHREALDELWESAVELYRDCRVAGLSGFEQPVGGSKALLLRLQHDSPLSFPKHDIFDARNTPHWSAWAWTDVYAIACMLLASRARAAQGGHSSGSIPPPPAKSDSTADTGPVQTAADDDDEPALNRDAREVACLYVLARHRAGFIPEDLARKADEWLTAHDINKRCANVGTIRPVWKSLRERGYVKRKGHDLITLDDKGKAWVDDHSEPPASI